MADKLHSQLDAMEALLDVNKLLDEKAHDQGIMFTTMDPTLRVKSGLSTGMYSFDLITGGGYAPGRFSYLYGDTGSGKSTTCYHGMKSALEKNIIVDVNDHESSMDPGYLKKIGIDLDDVCGRRNKKGKWEVTPKLRYSMGTTAEATFRFMNMVMKGLPDKIQMWDDKAEVHKYYVIAPDFSYKPTWTYISKGLKEGKIFEVDDFSPQMVFVTDSLKAMLPEARDEDMDSDPIALLARCFSNTFPLVKSLLGRKNCIYLATNHLTINPMIKFGCFHADTVIPFVDGRSPTIREVVEKKIEGDVWSYDETTGCIVPKKIIDWHFNGNVESPSDFVTVTCDAVDTANGVASFTCTLNHEILTADGWKQAGKLTTDDLLVTKYESTINLTLETFLLGTMVGDCTFVSKDDGVNSIKFQDNTNPEYVRWKVEKLSDHFSFRRIDSQLPSYVSESRHEFTVWKRRIGKREPDSVIHEMDDLSLALWFMDDGCGDFQDSHCRGILSVKRLKGDMDRMLLLKEAFKGKGLDCSVNVKDGSVTFNKEAFLTLAERICMYVPECMQYKLPEQFRGKYEDFSLMCEVEIEKEYVQVLSVAEGSARKFRQKGKYDISVEGTHNYMVGNVANGVIVHNSPETEPGGKAVQFYPDLKIKMHVNRAQNKIIEETHVSGEGNDRYILGKATVLKNKSGPCFRATEFRLWLDEQGNPGRGIDPVFDVFTFLSSCGLIEQPSKTTYGINLKGWETQSFTWKKFKELVLIREEGKALRTQIEEMLADGTAQELYYQTLATGSSTVKAKSEEDGKIETVEL